MSEFDATEMSMIRNGDFLGPKLGARVADVLSHTLPSSGGDAQSDVTALIEAERDNWLKEAEDRANDHGVGR